MFLGARDQFLSDRDCFLDYRKHFLGTQRVSLVPGSVSCGQGFDTKDGFLGDWDFLYVLGSVSSSQHVGLCLKCIVFFLLQVSPLLSGMRKKGE